MQALIVDDDPHVQRMLAKLLEGAGCYPTLNMNGREALISLGIGGYQAREEFDVLFLDINMPGLSGIEVVERIRREAGYEDIPIVMLTVDDRKEMLSQAFSSGADAYITKPITEMHSLAHLKTVVEWINEKVRRHQLEWDIQTTRDQIARAERILKRS